MTSGPTEFEKKRIRHASGESTTSNDSISAYIPTPPDGGWGWVICFASMLNNCIVDGIAFTFGVFYMEFVNYFGASKGKTAMAGSLLCGMYLCAGPLVSALVNRYGCRPVTVFGGLLASAGFFLSAFSTNIDMLIVTYGVLGGIGFGFIYLPSCVAVSYYFEKKRALATGLAVCGSGVGTFLFAPFGRWLLDNFDWRNAMMILAGITLNACVLGMLFRPLEPAKKIHRPRTKNIIDRIIENAKNKRGRTESETVHSQTVIIEKVREAKLTREKIICDEESESEMSSMPSLYFHSLRGVNRIGQDGTPVVSRQNSIQYSRQNSKGDTGRLASSMSPPTPSITISPCSTLPRIAADDSEYKFSLPDESPIANGDIEEKLLKEDNKDKDKICLDGNLPDVIDETTYIEGPVEIPEKMKDVGNTNGHANTNGKLNGEAIPMLKPNLINGHIKINDGHTYCASDTNILLRERRQKQKKPKTRVEQIQKQDYAKPLYRKDIFLSGSVINIPQFRSQPDMNSYVKSITTIPDSVSPEKESRCWSCIPKSSKDTLKMMLDLSILKNPRFLLICIGNVLLFIGFYIPFVYISDFAMENNISPTDGAWLISIIGITNTFGRVFMGWLADFPKVNALLLHNIALLVSGVATMLAPFCITYIPLVAFAAVFGLCVATFISLTSIVLCQLLGLEKLTNAFGMLTLFRGLSSIVGPPLAGTVFDATGNYTASFMLGGGMLLLSGILHMMLFLPCMKSPEAPIVLTEEVIPSPESDDECAEMLAHNQRSTPVNIV